jgi:hypothetical protein
MKFLCVIQFLAKERWRPPAHCHELLKNVSHVSVRSISCYARLMDAEGSGWFMIVAVHTADSAAKKATCISLDQYSLVVFSRPEGLRPRKLCRPVLSGGWGKAWMVSRCLMRGSAPASETLRRWSWCNNSPVLGNEDIVQTDED